MNKKPNFNELYIGYFDPTNMYLHDQSKYIFSDPTATSPKIYYLDLRPVIMFSKLKYFPDTFDPIKIILYNHNNTNTIINNVNNENFHNHVWCD